MIICNRCIYDDRIANISFDDEGVCNYCRQIEKLKADYGTGEPAGIQKYADILKEIQKKGKGKKYDCVIGVSGGTDSSYLMLKAKEWGLRPLAVHYDNTWNSAIATENIRKVTSALNIDLYTFVLNNKESDDLYLSFLKAGVPEFDAPTDMGFAQLLRQVAAKYGIGYILEGHSFVAEGLAPIGTMYLDAKYVKDVHSKFGKGRLSTYPLMSFWQFMKWTLIYKQQFIRPLWYIDYSKEMARKELIEKTGWVYYGGHHLENRASAFTLKILQPQKFGIDTRNWSLSAEVRAGILTREKALEIYNTPLEADPELVEYVQKRLNITDSEYNGYIKGPKKSFRDYKTYKKRFERLRPLFKILADRNLVPRSFYLKYCFPLPK